MADPTRDEVESRWQQLIDSTLTREQVHAWAAPWVEGDGGFNDLIVGIGLLHLYGFDLSRSTATSGVLQQHGGEAGRIFLRSDTEIAAGLEQWRQDVRAFDHDHERSRRNRLEAFHRSLLREGRVKEADRIRRALAGLDRNPPPP